MDSLFPKMLAEIETNVDIVFVIDVTKSMEGMIDIIQSMKKYNIEPKKIRFVHPNKNKEANIILIEGRKNGQPGIKVLNPIYSHEKNGEYTNEIQKYFK